MCGLRRDKDACAPLTRIIPPGPPVTGSSLANGRSRGLAAIRGPVTGEDLAGRGQQPGPDRRRVEDLDLVAEPGQPVHGRQFVLERQGHHPPAVVAGRCRGGQRGSGRRAEDLDGGPRVHPVCPVISAAGLHVLVISGPKQQDLRRDGRYALHSETCPPPRQDDGFA